MDPRIDAGRPEPEAPRERWLAPPVLWDYVVTGLVFLYASAFTLGLWRGLSPFPLLGSDASNIAGFIAARDHPDLLSRDVFLGRDENFRYYITIHIFLWRLLARLTGDYGTAALATLPFQILLQGCGFYLVGKTLLESRLWGFLLAIFSSPLLRLSVSFWGVYDDPVPQTTYQSFLPFLMYAAYRWRSVSPRWGWLMVFCGSLMYVHPVSAPAWAFAFWLGFLPFQPKEWSVTKRLFAPLCLGLVFLAIVAPFMANFAGHRTYGHLEDYETLRAAVEERLAPEFYDVGLAIRNFTRVIVERVPLLALTAICGAFLLLLSPRDRKRLGIVFVWIAGITAVAVGVPLCEQYVARRLHSLPYQIEIVRNLRFLVWFLQFFSIYLLMRIYGAFSEWQPARVAGLRVLLQPACVLFSLYLVWTTSPAPLGSAVATFSAWCEGKAIPLPDEEMTRFAEFIAAVGVTVPPGGRILPAVTRGPNRFQAIRYAALRPLSHIDKDGGTLTANNIEGFREWHSRRKVLREILALQDESERETRLIRFAHETGSDYLVLDRAPSAKLAKHVRVGNAGVDRKGLFLVAVPPEGDFALPDTGG